MRILLLLCTLSFSLTYAQLGGGGGMMGGGQGGQRGGSQGGGQGGQQRPEERVFNASEVAGIFAYDVNEAVKKIKIKKDKKLALDVSKAINIYNIKVKEIEILNKDNFDTLNVYVNTVMKSSMANRGQGRDSQQRGGYDEESSRERGENSDDPRRKIREIVREKVDPAKRAVEDEERRLNETLESLLNEKQYKKWLKYQEDVKEELNPKPQSNNQNGGGQMRSGGGQGGSLGGGGMR